MLIKIILCLKILQHKFLPPLENITVAGMGDIPNAADEVKSV